VASAKEMTVFTRQLGTLIKAGMPLLRSLEVLARQQKNQRFQSVIMSLGETIRSGGTFSEGLQQNPKVFDRLYINMVKAGEAGGVLEVVLDRLAQFMEKSVRVRGRIKSAMTYPLIIVLVAVGIVSALMVFVVPKFESIFATTLKGQALPMLTQIVIGTSNFLKNHAILAVGLVIGLYFLGQLLARTKSGTRFVHGAQLKMPVMGDLFLKSTVARFTRTLGTLLASGVSILEALRITRDTSGNVRVAAAITVVHDRVKEGDTVAGPLRATNIFPDMVPSMIEVGEETGALPDMLTRVADGYDEEVDNAVNALTSLIEPLMIVVMAFMVGTIVIALFLPIVRIIQSLG
jgi:type IV pilus assembly protein PilC